MPHRRLFSFFIAHAIPCRYRINIYNLPTDKVTLGNPLVQSALYYVRRIIIIDMYVSIIKVCQNRARERGIISQTKFEEKKQNHCVFRLELCNDGHTIVYA